MKVRHRPAAVTQALSERQTREVRRPASRPTHHPMSVGERAGASHATAVPLQCRRRLRRPDDLALALDPHHGLARHRRRAGARREGHREVDDRPRAGVGAAADRRRRRRPVLQRPARPRAAVARRSVRGRRRGRDPRRSGWSSCPSAPPRTGCSARCTSSARCPRARPSTSPGLLARAHRGILYVDEVNLLHDHLVDLLLDAAAMGRSTVERDGVSVEHAARFVLVGTMNPEEGELRPQLLDRFGLTVEVAAPRDPALRVEVVRRRMAYDADPDGFAASYADAERALTDADPGRPGAGRRRRAVRRRRCCRSPSSAPPSRSTACAPTSSPPAPPSRTPPGTAATTVTTRGHPRGRPARAAAPPPAQPVRRPRPRRGPARPGARRRRARRAGPGAPSPDDRRPTIRERSSETRRPTATATGRPTTGAERRLRSTTDRRSTRPARRARDAASRPSAPARRTGPKLFTVRGTGAGEAGKRSRAVTDTGRRIGAARRAARARST